MKLDNPLIVALDVFDGAEAVALSQRLRGEVGAAKVGMQLYTSEGPELVRALRETGLPVFLDLKFHDIPNTVALACRAAAEHGVWMLTLHASGGHEMMRAAVDAVEEYSGDTGRPAPLLLGVTVLTSLDAKNLQEIGVGRSVTEQVVRLARLAEESGLDGVVASAQEARHIREACGPDFLIVTPGIRPEGSAQADQKRTTTPREALEAGADLLVVGRPITAARDPAAAAREILRDIR